MSLYKDLLKLGKEAIAEIELPFKVKKESLIYSSAFKTVTAAPSVIPLIGIIIGSEVNS